MLKNLCLCVALLIITPVVSADTVEITPTDDAYVHSGSPSQNFGNEIILAIGSSVSGYYNTFIKFDLSSFSGATIQQANLRFFSSYSWGTFPTDSILITRNAADWSEGTITWNNKPGYLEPTPISSPSSIGWWTIDVTGWVQDMVDGTDPNFGFRVYRNGTVLDGFYMHSKENTDNRPELQIQYTPSTLQSMSWSRIKSVFE